MTPEEALQLVDNTFAQLNSSREGHAKMTEAVAALVAAIREFRAAQGKLKEAEGAGGNSK